MFNDKSVPIFSLSKIFDEKIKTNSVNNIYNVIIIENQEDLAAFIIDELICEQEIFHKKFTAPIIKVKNISGYTTLSTGEICLIINPVELLKNIALNNHSNNIELKNILIADKQDMFKNKKFVLLDDDKGKFEMVKKDLKSNDINLSVFNSVNSIYDYLCKNNVNYLIFL